MNDNIRHIGQPTTVEPVIGRLSVKYNGSIGDNAVTIVKKGDPYEPPFVLKLRVKIQLVGKHREDVFGIGNRSIDESIIDAAYNTYKNNACNTNPHCNTLG